jgi:hypothetical protein
MFCDVALYLSFDGFWSTVPCELLTESSHELQAMIAQFGNAVRHDRPITAIQQ